MVTAPNYGSWCDRKLWTVEESICLVLGVEPRTLWLKESHHLGGLDPLAEAIEQYAELAADAMALGTLQPFAATDLTHAPLERRVVPRRFLEWATAQQMTIPVELTSLLTRELETPAPQSSVLERLGRGYVPTDDDTVNAREQVLGAALAALTSFPDRCHNAADIRRVIEENAPLIWADTHTPPLSAHEIEALINHWLGRLG
jgi:hypothetical protein